MERPNSPGYFITLEGPEGSGKTSQIPNLAAHLRDLGLNVMTTREPGGTKIGEQTREIIHDPKNSEMHERTETLLYQSARAQIIEQVIVPMLKSGTVVISDRYADSTIAYQGYGREQDISKVKGVVEFATNGLVPDLTIYIDLQTEVGLSRKKKQNEWNRMDAQTADFHRRVKAGYDAIIREELMANEGTCSRFVVVDGSLPHEDVFINLKIALETRLQQEGLI